jgi:ubiquinone/menaquinone biosynthesis C-methylase UbiE
MFVRLIATVLAALLPVAPQQTATKRQPAPVMSSQGAGWLIRPERIQEEQPDQMLKALEIKPGSVVADVGAGVGYHVWRLAEIVGPTGKVFAEDIQPEMLRMMDKNIRDRQLQNVQIVLGTEKDPRLPAGQVDLVLMVDVYHEFSDPAAMMQNIRKSLKPDGRVVLVEFRQEDDRVPIRPEHKMSTDGVRGELEPLGFKFDKAIEFLPWQHILIFSVTNPL